MMLRLLPQFYCSYTIKDFFHSVCRVRGSYLSSGSLIEYFGCSNIYFTNYARTALRVFLSSLNLKKGSRIGVQAYTCHTVFEAIERSGHTPVFIDINHQYSIDINDLEKKIGGIDVLIVTHTFGLPANIDEIKSICKGKAIIEDCSHALFSKYRSQPVGTFGDASIFSYGYGKYPSIGPGGFILINNDRLRLGFIEEYNKIDSPSIMSEIKNIIKNFVWAVSFNRYVYGMFTFPIGKRIDNVLNLTGKSTVIELKGYATNVNLYIKKFDLYKSNYSKIQIKNGEYLQHSLMNVKSVVKLVSNYQPNYFIFPLLSKQRNSIVRSFYKNGIESSKYFTNSIVWAKKHGYLEGSCPNAEVVVKQIYTVPCYFVLKRKQLDRIVSIVEMNEELFST